MPHYAKCDVISEQNKKFKLKYLVNKTLERKSTKELVLKEQYHISRIFSFLFFLSLYRLLMDLLKKKTCKLHHFYLPLQTYYLPTKFFCDYR